MTKSIKLAAVGVGAALALTACQTDHPHGSTSQQQGQQQTETAFQQQSAAVPYPVTALTDSEERRNLREKLLRENKPERLGYLYILTITGVPLGYYTIQGKVSSNDSQMTTSTLVLHDGYNGGGSVLTIPAPQDNGSYGGNEPGIFFFTTEGAMVKTDANYLYSDQPISAFINLPKLNGNGKVTDLTARK